MRTPTIIIVAFALGTVACQSREPYVGPGETPVAQGQPPKEVVDDPPYGEQVTVQGKVDSRYGPRVFTMRTGLFRDDLLVVAPQGFVMEDPEEIEVVGTVRRMNIAEVEQQYGLDIANQLDEDEQASRPVLIAESVQQMPDEGLFNRDRQQDRDMQDRDMQDHDMQDHDMQEGTTPSPSPSPSPGRR